MHATKTAKYATSGHYGLSSLEPPPFWQLESESRCWSGFEVGTGTDRGVAHLWVALGVRQHISLMKWCQI